MAKQESKPDKQLNLLSKTANIQKKTNLSTVKRLLSKTMKDFFRNESKDMNEKNIKSFEMANESRAD